MRALHPDALDLDLLVDHTYALAATVARAGLDAPVPSCGEWTMGDLAFHLFEVQHFWSHTIEHRPAGPEIYDRPEPLTGEHDIALRRGVDRLAAALRAADPAEHAWSWSSDHTVGFSVRRQIHEALVHRIDGDLATGQPLPVVEPALAADGVDEMVDVMLTGIPEWATFVPTIQVAQLHTTDTGDRWTVSLGHISGTSAETGVSYDGLPAADRVADDVPVDVTIEGRSLDVLLWLWGRFSSDRLSVIGEADVVDALRATVASATQ